MKRRRRYPLVRWCCYRVCELESVWFGEDLVNVLQILARLRYVCGPLRIRTAMYVKHPPFWVCASWLGTYMPMAGWDQCSTRIAFHYIKTFMSSIPLLDSFRSVLLVSVNVRFTDNVSAIV